MEQTKVELLYKWIDETTELIQHQMNISYIECLAIGLEYLFTQNPNDDINDLLKQQLDNRIKSIDNAQF